MTTRTKRRLTELSGDDLAKLLALIGGADSVELKLTLPEGVQRSAIAALGLDPLEAQIRQVFFFDPLTSCSTRVATKCLPQEAFQVGIEARAYFESVGIDLSADQQTKTKAALDFFAAELRDRPSAA